MTLILSTLRILMGWDGPGIHACKPEKLPSKNAIKKFVHTFFDGTLQQATKISNPTQKSAMQKRIKNMSSYNLIFSALISCVYT